MSATAVQVNPSSFLPKPSTKVAKPISWEEFQKKYLSREDSFKYEWVNGQVVKTKRGMDKTQLFIQFNLIQCFRNLFNEGKVNGELIAEPDLFFLSNHRRPDITWLTKAQIYRLADPEAYEVPAFIIEVISSNDQMNTVREKMINYRDAGVKVVWHIFPKMQQVDVYAGKNLSQSQLCSGDDVCSAEPALPNFQITVNEIFSKK
jgi:Uma2 family endonuclease